MIDGTRGSGKTSLVRAIRYFSEQCCPKQNNLEAEAQHQFQAIWNSVDQGKNGPTREPSEILEPIVAGAQRRRLMLALPLIRPDHMETSETIMEGVFAQIAELLTREECKAKQQTSTSDRAERLAKLRRKLHAEVAKGWYFSRRMGIEALLNDSMSFSEYIERRSSEATTSHTRITNWRKFVVELLDLLDAQMLGVFVDDTDVASSLTVDLLHSIRMYFCHPRIITVVAGNMHTMRQRLLQDAMSRISLASRPLRSSHSLTAAFWRRFERENVEEHLEKVFPRPMRQFIYIRPNDVRVLLGGRSFSNFCEDQMKVRLERFLHHRIKTCLTSPDDPAPTFNTLDHEKNEVENYLALWLLKNHYISTLMPSTARHMNQFQSIVSGQTMAGQEPRPLGEDGSNERRVAVALFTEPRNFELVQRFTDRDRSVIDWLKQHDVSVAWREPRKLRINQLDLSFSSPSVDFLFYRLDLEFAMPRSVRGLVSYAEKLLPKVSGNAIWAPEIWETRGRAEQLEFIKERKISRLSDGVLRLRQEVVGVALSFYSPVIPANCLYLKDIRCLPDLMWRPRDEQPPRKGREEAGQIDAAGAAAEWGDLPVKDIDALFDIDRYDVRNSYFRNVVLILGTFPLPPPVPTDLHRKQDFGLLEYEWVTVDGKSASEDRPTDKKLGDIEKREMTAFSKAFKGDAFFGGPRQIIAAAYSNELESDEKVSSLSMHRIKNGLISILTPKNKTKNKKASNEEGREEAESVATQFVDRVLPRYHRIVCDVRRAYVAMRILESDLNDYEFQHSLEKADGPSSRTSENPLFTHSANDKIKLVGLHKLRTILGLDGISHIRRVIREGDLTPIERLPEDHRYFRPDGSAHWRGVLEKEEFKSASEVKNLIAILEKAVRKTSADRATSKAILLQCAADKEAKTSDGNSDAQGDLYEQRRQASQMRSLLLFLWGVGPCLSSLIHLEVMGEWYWWTYDYSGDVRNNDMDTRRQASLVAVLDKWSETLEFAARFTVLFSLALETNLKRQIRTATATDSDGNEASKSEKFTPFPDFSISTLGLRIFRKEGASSDTLDEEKAGSFQSFEGVVGDTLLRIQLALWYVEHLKKWVTSSNSQSPRTGTSPASAQKKPKRARGAK